MLFIVLRTVGVHAPFGNLGGGITAIQGLLQEWIRFDHKVVVISEIGNAVSRAAEIASVSPESISLPSFSRKDLDPRMSLVTQNIFNHFLQMRVLRNVSERLRDDKTVVIASSPCLSDILAVLYLCRVRGRLGVVYFHHLITPPWKFPLRRGGPVRVSVVWLLQTLYLALAKIGNLSIALDHPCEISETGWRIANRIIPDGHSVSAPAEFVEFDSERAIYDACFLGRLHAQKGVLDLVKIWTRVVEDFPRAKLAIAGSPGPKNLERKFDREIRKKRLSENIVRLGPLNEVEKWALLRQSKLMILPSYEEGWSLTVMEAATCRTPSIVYDLRAYDYMQNAVKKVKVGDANSAASSVIALLQDEPGRNEMGNRAKQIVGYYTPETIARNQLQVFEEILDSQQPAPENAKHNLQVRIRT